MSDRMAEGKDRALAKTNLRLPPDAAAVEIARRALALAAEKGGRVIVGVAGGPGVGKSTLVEQAVGILNAEAGGRAAMVPMDGFHMRQAKLEAKGLAALKGAPGTFEAQGFVDLLKRLKVAKEPVPVPGYSRETEDVVSGMFAIGGDVPILITEGNYLLLDRPPWDRVPPLLDLAVFVDLPPEIVRQRLLKRHAEHGLFTKERNKRHIEAVDMVNYQTVRASRGRADVVIALDSAT